jgi:hypothetical protein
MSDKDTGGSAFPTLEANYESTWADSGMTLRDYFAAQMLASVFSAQTRNQPSESQIAEAAYRMADAMIQARKA